MASAKKTQGKPPATTKQATPPSPPTSLPHFRLNLPDQLPGSEYKEQLLTAKQSSDLGGGTFADRYAQADAKRAETDSDVLEKWELDEFSKHEKHIPEMTKDSPWGNAILKDENLRSPGEQPPDFRGDQKMQEGFTLASDPGELDPAKWRTTPAVKEWMLQRKNWKLQARYKTLDPSQWDRTWAGIRDANRVVGVGMDEAAQGAVDFLVNGSNLLKQIAKPIAKAADFWSSGLTGEGMVPQSVLDSLDSPIPHKDMSAMTWAVGKALSEGKISPDEFFEARDQHYQEQVEREEAWKESQDVLDEDRWGLKASLSLSRGLGFAANMFMGPMPRVAKLGEAVLGRMGTEWTASHMLRIAEKAGLDKATAATMAKNGDLFRVVTKEMLEQDKFRTALINTYNRALPPWMRGNRSMIDDRMRKLMDFNQGTIGGVANKSLAWGTAGFIGGHEGHRMQEGAAMAVLMPVFVMGGRMVSNFGKKFLEGASVRLPVEAALEGTAFSFVDYENWGDMIEAYKKGDLEAMGDAGVAILGTGVGFAAMRMMAGGYPRKDRPPSGDYNRSKPSTALYDFELAGRKKAREFFEGKFEGAPKNDPKQEGSLATGPEKNTNELLGAIAKLGGLNKAEATGLWGLEKNLSKVRGKGGGANHVFKVKGKSVDQISQALQEDGWIPEGEADPFGYLEGIIGRALAGERIMHPVRGAEVLVGEAEQALVEQEADLHRLGWIEANGLTKSPIADERYEMYGHVDDDLAIAMMKLGGLLHPPEGSEDATFDLAQFEVMERLGLREEGAKDILDSVVGSGWQTAVVGESVKGSLLGAGEFTLTRGEGGLTFTPDSTLAEGLGIEKRTYLGAEALGMMDVLARSSTLSLLEVKNRFLPEDSGWLPTDDPGVYMHWDHGLYTERFGQSLIKPHGEEWQSLEEPPERSEPGPAQGEMDALTTHLMGLVAEQRATGGVIEDPIRFNTAKAALNLLSRPSELPEETQIIFTDPVWPQLLENASDPDSLIDMVGRVLSNQQPASSALEDFMLAETMKADAEMHAELDKVDRDTELDASVMGAARDITDPSYLDYIPGGDPMGTDVQSLPPEKGDSNWVAPPGGGGGKPPAKGGGGKGGSKEPDGGEGDKGDMYGLGKKLAHEYPGVMSWFRTRFTAESRSPIEAGSRYLLEQMQGRERLADNAAMRFMRDATELFGESYLNSPATGGDLIAAIEGTGNPHYDRKVDDVAKRDAVGHPLEKGEKVVENRPQPGEDTYADVRKRLETRVWPSNYEAMKTSISRVVSGRRGTDAEGKEHIIPTEMSPLDWVDNVVRPMHDKLFKEALDRGDFTEDAYREMFLAHKWKVKSRKLSGASKYEMGAMGMKSPHSKHRVIDTYADGIRGGLIPATHNPVNIVGGYIKVQGRVGAHQELRDALKSFELPTSEEMTHEGQTMRVLMPSSSPRARDADYLEIDHPAFQNYSIHPGVADVLARALAANPLEGNAFFDFMFGINSLMKSGSLTGSLFHPAALIPESGTFTGKGTGKAWKDKSAVGKAVSLTPVTGFQAFLAGRKIMLEQPRVDRAIKAGVIGVGQGGRGTSDLHNELKFEMIEKVGQALKKIPKLGDAVKKSTTDILREAVKVNDAIVWEFAHQYTKVSLFESVADSLKAKYPDEDIRIIEKQAAQFVNYALGGLNTQAWFRVSKPTLKFLQAIPLSLDWTMANLGMAMRGPVGMGVDAFKWAHENLSKRTNAQQEAMDAEKGEMIREDMHLPKWARGLGGTSGEARAYWARAMIYMTAMVDMAQWTWLQTTLDDEEKEAWLDKHGTFHIWPMPWEWGSGATGNPPGKRFGYMGIGIDEKGRGEFARHGKQIQETVDMAYDPGRTATGKLGPMIQLGSEVMGFMKKQGGPDFWSGEMWGDLLRAFGEKFMPFSGRGITDPNQSGMFMWAYPVSKAVTNSFLRDQLGAELADWAEGTGNLDTIDGLLADAQKNNRYGTTRLQEELRETRKGHYDDLKELLYDYDESAIADASEDVIDRLVALGTTQSMVKTVLKTWKSKALDANRPFPEYADDRYLLYVERLFPKAMSPITTPRGYALSQLLRDWRGVDDEAESELRGIQTGEGPKRKKKTRK